MPEKPAPPAASRSARRQPRRWRPHDEAGRRRAAPIYPPSGIGDDSSTCREPSRIAVAGASGRMGHMLIEAVRGSGDLVLAGALDIAGSPALSQDASADLGAASGVRSPPTCAPAGRRRC